MILAWASPFKLLTVSRIDTNFHENFIRHIAKGTKYTQTSRS